MRSVPTTTVSLVTLAVVALAWTLPALAGGADHYKISKKLVRQNKWCQAAEVAYRAVQEEPRNDEYYVHYADTKEWCLHDELDDAVKKANRLPRTVPDHRELIEALDELRGEVADFAISANRVASASASDRAKLQRIESDFDDLKSCLWALLDGLEATEKELRTEFEAAMERCLQRMADDDLRGASYALDDARKVWPGNRYTEEFDAFLEAVRDLANGRAEQALLVFSRDYRWYGDIAATRDKYHQQAEDAIRGR